MHVQNFLSVIRSFIGAVLLGSTALAHDVPDGHVQRSVQIVFHADHVQVDYYVGISEKTIADQWPLLRQPDALDSDPQRALDQYRVVAAGAIAAKLTIELNGQQLPLTLTESANAPKHHVSFSCTFRAELTAENQSGAVRVCDANYSEFPGSHRLAMKGRANSQLLDCTASPILARTSPLTWEDLSQEERAAITTATGTLVTDPGQ